MPLRLPSAHLFRPLSCSIRRPKTKRPAHCKDVLGISFWRRPIDSRVPTRSPATLAGLTIYVTRLPSGTSLTTCGVPPRRVSSRTRSRKCKNPTEINPAGFLVLATSYSRTAYRRTTIGAAAFHCRVRNGNGWCHCATVTRVRNRTGRFAAVAATQARGRISDGLASDTDALQFNFERT